jgi:hypothetical protein
MLCCEEEELETIMAITYPSTETAIHWRGVVLYIAMTFAFGRASFGDSGRIQPRKLVQPAESSAASAASSPSTRSA